MDAFDEHVKYIVTSVLNKQMPQLNKDVEDRFKEKKIEIKKLEKPPVENEDYRVSITDFEFGHIFSEDDVYAIVGIMTQNHLPKIGFTIVDFFKKQKATSIEISDIVYEYIMERERTHKIAIKFTYKILK